MTQTTRAARTCDGCGMGELEGLAGPGFWIWDGGASCGPCLKTEAELDQPDSPEAADPWARTWSGAPQAELTQAGALA